MREELLSGCIGAIGWQLVAIPLARRSVVRAEGRAMRRAMARLTTDNGERFAVAGLLGIHTLLLAWGTVVHSPTVDEPMHLAAGIYHWQTGRFDLDRGNPPLAGLVAAAPVLAAGPETDWRNVPDSFAVCVDFWEANGFRTCQLVNLGRWALVPISLLGGYVCYRWARELYGVASGLVALTLWSFSPNILAHGQLVTGDMAATAMGVTAFYLFWRWLLQPTMRRAALAGLFLGLAELSKYVWVLLFALWPVMWIAWRLASRHSPERLTIVREMGHLVLVFAVSLYVINLGYGFERSMVPLERFGDIRRVLANLVGYDEEGGVAACTASVPLPFPENYVGGIDEIAMVGGRPKVSYLRRQYFEGGCWYYYPYAMLVKLPLGTMALLLCAGVFTLMMPLRGFGRSELFLAIGIVAILAFVTRSGAGQRLRYVLPVMPLLLVAASKSARGLTAGRVPAAFVVVALCSTVLSSLWTYPHSLSYFNELAGGPFQGHAHLRESNIDWGQDFLYLQRWLRKHPEATPLGLSWNHPILDPKHLGIEYTEAPAGLLQGCRYTPAQLFERGPRPGWYAVNVDRFRRRTGDMAYFFYFEPVATAGYSIYIYHISMEDANQVRRQIGLPELAASDELPPLRGEPRVCPSRQLSTVRGLP